MLNSCTDKKNDDPLKEREAILLMKEKEFDAKQQEYESLKAMRDSLQRAPDSVVVEKIPAQILGKWTGKMICTDSNCSEHVIGDQRNDIWEFSEEGVTITNKTGGERMYTGRYSGSEIKFVSENSPAAASESTITLQIAEDKPERMKGLREVSGTDCLAKFSIDLEKIKN